MPHSVKDMADMWYYSAPMLLYPSDETDNSLDELAYKTAAKLRGILIDGAKEMGGHYSYVNYAYGAESPGEVYGAENLPRLRQLKKEYDPQNRFRWTAAVVDEARGMDDDERHRDEL
jgi:hypothetical protein